MPINCIAIDDDLSSLENLNSYLNTLPDLQLVKSYTDPLKALTDISVADKVDIIFMDIEMPSLSGIELASLLRDKTKHLIFTTAHTKYAIEAFSVEADAYLLKPYSILHFTETINSLYPNKSTDISELDDDFFYIPIQNDSNKLVKIMFSDLISLEEINELVYFRTIKQSYISFKLNFNKMLNEVRRHPEFIQISSSAIISKTHIRSFLGDQIVLFGGTSVSLGSKYKDSFISFLKENLLNNKLIKEN